MREIGFRVYYEMELPNGEIINGMEESWSWFLLTQTGEIMEYGPMRPPSRPDKEYKKLIPLFYIGLCDKTDKKIYEGDIVEFNGYRFKIAWETLKARFWIFTLENGDFQSPTQKSREKVEYPFLCGKNNNCKYIKVIGNIYENNNLTKQEG